MIDMNTFYSYLINIKLSVQIWVVIWLSVSSILRYLSWGNTQISTFPSLSHVLFGAGIETTRNVAADVSSFTIDGLQSDSAYTVLISTLTGSREGSPSTLSVRTGTALNLSNTRSVFLRETWLRAVEHKIE